MSAGPFKKDDSRREDSPTRCKPDGPSRHRHVVQKRVQKIVDLAFFSESWVLVTGLERGTGAALTSGDSQGPPAVVTVLPSRRLKKATVHLPNGPRLLTWKRPAGVSLDPGIHAAIPASIARVLGAMGIAASAR